MDEQFFAIRSEIVNPTNVGWRNARWPGKLLQKHWQFSSHA